MPAPDVGDREEAWAQAAEPFPADAPLHAQALALLRYAVLAPSSHNTQPWRFNVEDATITVWADTDRWLHAADPRQRELHISLGCATENILIAAEHHGLGHTVGYQPRGPTGPAVEITLDPDTAPPAQGRARLFPAIPERHTARELEGPSRLPAEARAALEQASFPGDPMVVVVEDRSSLAKIAELTADAERELFADEDYRAELAAWVSAGALGHRWPLSWLSGLVVEHLDLGGRVAARDVEALSAVPAAGLILTRGDGHPAQLRTGQVFQRAALSLQQRGLAVHPMSAAVEVERTREALARLHETPGHHAQHLFRIGTPTGKARRTPRRTVDAVLDRADR